MATLGDGPGDAAAAVAPRPATVGAAVCDALRQSVAERGASVAKASPSVAPSVASAALASPKRGATDARGVARALLRRPALLPTALLRLRCLA